MSRIYLVRHGQAGTRGAYDSLSEAGRRQSRLLGEYFVAHGIRFAAAYAGAMSRQQQTGDEVRQAYARAGISFPEIEVDQAWNEIGLDRVYAEIAPQLAAEEEEFRREYDALCEQARKYADEPGALVHRKWQGCDTSIVEAWIAGRFPYTGEGWQQFCERVVACRSRLRRGPQDNVLVFTSAVPVSVWAGLSLDIADQRIMRLAGVLYNTSYTIVRLTEDDLRLFAFNSTPHLAAPELRTHR